MEPTSVTSGYLAITILLGVLALVGYIFDYDGERFDEISSKVEQERWEDACGEFGELTSDLYLAIDDHPNIFEDILEDGEDTADFAQDVFSDVSDFDDLTEVIVLAKEPKRSVTRCWIGSFFSPFAYGGSAVFLAFHLIVTNPTLSQGFILTSYGLFVIALTLSVMYVFYRVRLRRYATSQTFMG